MKIPFAFLTTEAAFDTRREWASPPGSAAPDPLTLVSALRSRFPEDHARALAEQIGLERRAAAKFSDPTRLLFERIALEQATSPGIARYHATCVPRGARVVDLGCGLGADSIAMARAGCRVIAVDRDPDRARLARHNLQEAARDADGAAGPAAGEAGAGGAAGSAVVVGDAEQLPARGDVLFVDPDRRTPRGRVFRLQDTSPPWSAIAALTPRFEQVLVKAPPALPNEEVPPEAAVEFLSEGSECREALLRLGGDAQPGTVRAVLVEHGLRREIPFHPLVVAAAPGAYLLDPDPALRRAGGVDALAAESGAARVAAESTYLFADRVPETPWVRAYRVLEVLPYRKRDLARRLAAEPPSELIVKQRGVGVPEADIRRGLKTRPDGPSRVVVLWADGARRVACLGEAVHPR